MIKNTKLRSEGVKKARELIYTAERQASRDVSLAGLRPKPGSSQDKPQSTITFLFFLLQMCKTTANILIFSFLDPYLLNDINIFDLVFTIL
jgi:hypothetical protein